MACALAWLDAAATCHKDDKNPLKEIIMIIEAISVQGKGGYQVGKAASWGQCATM